METTKRPSAIEALKIASGGDPDYLRGGGSGANFLPGTVQREWGVAEPHEGAKAHDALADDVAKSSAVSGSKVVEAALFPPVASLTIDKDVTDLTIRGSVVRLTVDGPVETLVINGQVVNLHLSKG